jgi:phage gp36-like protein
MPVMPYATPTDLLFFGAAELSQLAAPEDNRVTGDLLRLTIESGDRSAHTAEEIAAADAALLRLEGVLDRASKRIDSYLAPKYPLPLSSELIAGSELGQACMDISRFLLMEDAATDTVKDRYDRAVAWLRDLSNGKASLGPVDTAVATPTGRPVLRTGVSGHDWNTY